MGDHRGTKVAVIVPAFNEEARVGTVLRAVTACKLASEVIVVSDGSTDRTVEVARSFPNVRVVELKINVGKGGAMMAGVHSTDAPIVAFVDADLLGLMPVHIDRIILPLLVDDCEMCVGIFRGGKRWSDAAHTVSPFLSGQRAMKRELFESVANIGELRMGVEVAITQAARRTRARVLKVILRGVSNCHKEQKMGIMKGLAARTKMYKEISAAMVKNRRRRRPRSQRQWRPWDDDSAPRA